MSDKLPLLGAGLIGLEGLCILAAYFLCARGIDEGGRTIGFYFTDSFPLLSFLFCLLSRWRASDRTTRLPISSITRALAFSSLSPPPPPALASSSASTTSTAQPTSNKQTNDESNADLDKEKEKEKAEAEAEEALDEAECIAANMIFKGYVRGYISHEKRMLVLAAKNAFPSLSRG